jgi:hypothetical protein
VIIALPIKMLKVVIMKFLNKSVVLFILLASFNANALLVKLDFSSLGSLDLWKNTTDYFDVTQAGLNASDFGSITQSILLSVQEDYYSSSYGFINSNQELDVDFMIAQVSDDVSTIDVNNYTIQIGSRTSGPHNGFGVACLGCVSNATVAANSIFGSVFSNNIFNVLTTAAGGLWDLTETVNAIAGTLSHEIGHALGVDHPPGQQSNPGESLWDVMATGSSPSNMPNDQRLLNRAFSDINMQTLVNNIGLRTIPVPEPSTSVLFLLASLLMFRTFKTKR